MPEARAPGAARRGAMQGAIGFLARTIAQLSLFAVTIVAIRSLGVADFGAFAIAAAFMFLFRRLFYVGAYEHLLRSPKQPTLNGSTLLANLIVAAGSIALVAGLSFAAERVFGSTLVGELMRLLAPSLLLASFTSWFEALLLRRQQMNRYYAAVTLGEIVGAAAALGALAAGLGVFALVVQIYARIAVLLVLFAGFRMRTSEPLWSGASLAEARAIVAWSGSRYATVTVNFFSIYGSDLMLGAFLSTASAGLYRAGNRIVTAITDLFAQPLQKIAQTNLSARAASGLPANAAWLGMFASVAAIGWSALAALAMLADELVPAVLGEQWRAAAPIVTVMCVVRAMPILDAATASMLVSHDRRNTVFGAELVTATLGLASAALLARHGALAVAIGFGAVVLVQSSLLFTAVARLTAVGPRDAMRAFRVALTPALGVVLATYAAKLWLPPELTEISRIVALSGAAGFGALLGLALVRRPLVASLHLLAPSGAPASLGPAAA